ncbi:hypothetical protein [Massilia sp. HP4]|uniref:hypothetical protein n=1 Tax=Massilia sp. HP4 TaxID=2562316 RepID=UPI0014851D90|nr:hypothetical protein [Massilia sp. HP4]
MSRQDVNTAANLPKEANVGFRINLSDELNDLPDDYALIHEGNIVWDYCTFTSSISAASEIQITPFLNQRGSREVVVIYTPESWLHRAISKIHNWNSNYFSKGYSSGVSFSFLSSGEIQKGGFSVGKGDHIFLIEDNAYRDYKISNSILCNRDHAILSESTNGRDFSGIFSVANSLMPPDARFATTDAIWMLRFFTTFVTYSDLFFDSQNLLYTYHSGSTEIWMRERVRRAIERTNSSDILIFTKENIKISHLNQINDQNCVTFVRLNALKYILDAMNESNLHLIKTALMRGIRISIINKDGE